MQSTPPRLYHFHTILDRRSLSPKNKCANSQRDCNLISMTVIGIKAMQYKNHHILSIHFIASSAIPLGQWKTVRYDGGFILCIPQTYLKDGQHYCLQYLHTNTK